MAVINTTNVIESGMFLKARLPKNLVGDNYYIQTLQQKIDYEWTYRYNVIDIDEENHKQMQYTTDYPIYTPIEAVIQQVITDTGEKLSDDWKKLVFKKVNHDISIGKRYRFSNDYEVNINRTEEEKRIGSSIWIGVNINSVEATSGAVVRRCNGYLRFAGSPDLSYDNITEYHTEPCIIDSDLKNIQVYMNDIVNINQAEVYAIMQYNYFSKNVQVNDRFFLGAIDIERKLNNTVFKVKAVEKFKSNETFSEDCPLILVAFDRDVLSDKEDYQNKIASHPTLYKVPDNNDGEDIITVPSDVIVTEDLYSFQVKGMDNTVLLLDEVTSYDCCLYKNNDKLENTEFILSPSLEGVKDETLYYEIEQKDNIFTVLNKRTCLKSNLILNFTCVDEMGVTHTVKKILKLGGMV